MKRFFIDHYRSIVAVAVSAVAVAVIFAYIASAERMKLTEYVKADEDSRMLRLLGSVVRLADGDTSDEAVLMLRLTVDMSPCSDGEKRVLRQIDADGARSIVSMLGDGGTVESAKRAIAEYVSETANNELGKQVAEKSVYEENVRKRADELRKAFYGKRIKMRRGFTRTDEMTEVLYTNNAYLICSVGKSGRVELYNPIGLTDKIDDVESGILSLARIAGCSLGAVTEVGCETKSGVTVYKFISDTREVTVGVGDDDEIVFFSSRFTEP